MEDDFLTQQVRETDREGVLPDVVFANIELVGDSKFRGHAGHSNHKMTYFRFSEKQRGWLAELPL